MKITITIDLDTNGGPGDGPEVYERACDVLAEIIPDSDGLTLNSIEVEVIK